MKKQIKAGILTFAAVIGLIGAAALIFITAPYSLFVIIAAGFFFVIQGIYESIKDSMKN